MNEFEIKIEKDIPFANGTKRTKWPFEQMAVGDSFAWLPDGGQRGRLVYAAAQFKVRHPGWSYATRQQPAGSYRLWRLS